MYRDGRTRGDVRLLAVMLGLILVAKKDRDFVIAQSMPSLAQVPLLESRECALRTIGRQMEIKSFPQNPKGHERQLALNVQKTW